MKIAAVSSLCLLFALGVLYEGSLAGGNPQTAVLGLLLVIGSLYLLVEGLRSRSIPVVLPTAPEKADRTQAEVVGLLALLQRKGRLIDFLMDDIAQYNDQQVGAAARVVHQGCSEVLKEYFQVEPIRPDAEGVAVTLEKNYDPNRNRLVGKVTGQPPFRGVLLHRGWKTTKIDLPRTINHQDSSAGEIIAPAEIELR